MQPNQKIDIERDMEGQPSFNESTAGEDHGSMMTTFAGDNKYRETDDSYNPNGHK